MPPLPSNGAARHTAGAGDRALVSRGIGPLAHGSTDRPVRRDKTRHERGYELSLWLLAYDCEDHPDRRGLCQGADSIGEFAVLREEEIVGRRNLPVEPTVVQTLQPKRCDGVDSVPEESERFDETLGEVLTQEDPHEGVSSFDRASSSRAPRTASSVSVGYARTISALVMPAASDSRRNAIDMRVPSMRGLPPRCSGSATIHFIVRFPPPVRLPLSYCLMRG